MKKDCNDFYPPLPPQIKNKWSITKALICSANAQIYAIQSLDNPEDTKILKIISKSSFNKNIYKKVTSIKSQYILKPSKVISFKQNCYMLTQYRDNLCKVIYQNGLSGSDILKMAHDICISLKQLHSKKILHLDCTPANIYLNEDGSYCLGDFSSAVLSNSKTAPLTATTFGYVPPEISEGLQANFLSDVYIFSRLLYTLFNNGYTISDSTDTSIKDNIPQELYSIIIKGCAKNPSERYSSIGEMEGELNSPAISEELFNYNYYLHITDEMHPLHYLKTPLINANAVSKHKKHFKADILCGTLIVITGAVFLFSFYNYYKKNNLQREKNIQIDEADKLKSIVKSQNTPVPALTATPKITTAPTAAPSIIITDFDISNKNLKSLPNPQNADFECDKLSCLYANNNKIVDIGNIKHYTSLKELYLADNLLADLSPLEEINNLHILVLSYNKITDLLPICSLTSLTNLDISGNNKMYNFSELVSLYNLKTLNITNTNVTRDEVDFLKCYLPDCEILY